MNKVLHDYLQSIEFGNFQNYRNLTLIPLISKNTYDFTYLTLKQALERNSIVIEEISSSGSIPDLKVLNKSDMPVLMLDGEELSGAKQNRIVNTTILLKEESETVIPVSCTEQGRWRYTSNTFKASGHLSFHKLRSAKHLSVSSRLKRDRRYKSDQLNIWNEVSDFQKNMNYHSPTSAMKDVIDHRKEIINEYLSNFNFIDLQRGILIIINNKIVGMDMLSSSDAYNNLHDKLLKSYILEAIMNPSANANKIDKAEVSEYIKLIIESNEAKYRSVGYGWDHRFESRIMVGSALIHNDMVIHIACFTRPAVHHDDNIRSSQQRCNFRI